MGVVRVWFWEVQALLWLHFNLNTSLFTKTLKEKINHLNRSKCWLSEWFIVIENNINDEIKTDGGKNLKLTYIYNTPQSQSFRSSRFLDTIKGASKHPFLSLKTAQKCIFHRESLQFFKGIGRVIDCLGSGSWKGKGQKHDVRKQAEEQSSSMHNFQLNQHWKR